MIPFSCVWGLRCLKASQKYLKSLSCKEPVNTLKVEVLGQACFPPHKTFATQIFLEISSLSSFPYPFCQLKVPLPHRHWMCPCMLLPQAVDQRKSTPLPAHVCVFVSLCAHIYNPNRVGRVRASCEEAVSLLQGLSNLWPLLAPLSLIAFPVCLQLFNPK